MPAPHHSVFYRPDARPTAQPTASEHRSIKYSLYERSHYFVGDLITMITIALLIVESELIECTVLFREIVDASCTVPVFWSCCEKLVILPYVGESVFWSTVHSAGTSLEHLHICSASAGSYRHHHRHRYTHKYTLTFNGLFPVQPE